MAQHKNRPPTPPGELLQDFLDGLEMTQTRLAERMGVTVQTVNLIIRGHRAITAQNAIRLARAFETTPQFWMNAQNAVELWLAQKKMGHGDLNSR